MFDLSHCACHDGADEEGKDGCWSMGLFDAQHIISIGELSSLYLTLSGVRFRACQYDTFVLNESRGLVIHFEIGTLFGTIHLKEEADDDEIDLLSEEFTSDLYHALDVHANHLSLEFWLGALRFSRDRVEGNLKLLGIDQDEKLPLHDVLSPDEQSDSLGDEVHHLHV